MIKLLAATGYKSKTADYEGRQYLVVPVVALTEGAVWPMAAKGYEFVAASELRASGWDNRPIYVSHPTKNGAAVSGNSQELLSKTRVGWVFNAAVKNKKLLMEAWIDRALCEEREPKLLERLEAGEPIEVSVGAYVDLIEDKGTWQGRKYEVAWSRIVPDHLALLPDGDLGACSNEMGCGVRAAGAGDMRANWLAVLEPGEETDALLETLRNIPQSVRDKMPASDFAGPDRSFPIEIPEDVFAASHALGRAKGDHASIKSRIISIAYRKGASFVAQLPEDWKRAKDQAKAAEMGWSFLNIAQLASEMTAADLQSKLYDALRDVEPLLLTVMTYLPVTNPNRVIYSCWDRPNDYATSTIWQRAFNLADNGIISLDTNRVEVEPVMTYEPVMNEEPISSFGIRAYAGARHSGSDRKAIQAMHDQSVYLGATCSPMAAAMGAPCSCHSRPNRGAESMTKEQLAKFLESATPEQIALLSTVAEGKPTPGETTALAEKDAAVKAAAEAKAAGEKSEAELKAAQEKKPPTFAELLAAADGDVRESINSGIAAAKAKKEASIKALKDTGRCPYSDEELAALTQGQLDSLTKLAAIPAKKEVDYSANAPRGAQTPTGAPPPPSLVDAIRAARQPAVAAK